MRLLTCVLILSAIGCAKAPSEPAGPCTTLESPYMVEYPDGSLRKSDVQECSDSLKATALDGSGDAVESSSLTIQLWNYDENTHVRTAYFTTL